MYFLIKPLGSSAFKWGGVSSILISGAVNTGYYEPVPAPSTIYGFLKYAYIIMGIGSDAPEFSGPYFYAKGKESEAICVHSYPSGLLCRIQGEMCLFKIKEEQFEHRIGIALDRKQKITKEGYVYMQKMLDLSFISKEILGEEPENYGVMINVLDDSAEKLKNFVGPFGGESRPAKVYSVEPEFAGGIKKKLLASPALINSISDKKAEWKCGHAEIDIFKDEGKKIIIDKISVRMLSAGFDNGKRLPMFLAIMPTVEVKDNVKRIGMYSEKGWGSVVEI